MKIMSNTPSIGRAGIGSKIRLSNDAYRGTAQAYYGLAHAVGGVNKQIQMDFDNKIETRTLNTINEYNTGLNALSQKYSSMPYSQENNYLQDYQKEAEQLKKDYKKKLMPYEMAHMAFDDQTNNTYNVNFENLKNGYVQKEQENKTAVYDNFLTDNLNTFAQKPTFESFQQGLANIKGAASIYTKGKGEEVFKSTYNKAQGDYIANVTNHLLSKNDFVNLKALEQSLKGTQYEALFPKVQVNTAVQAEQNREKLDKSVGFWRNVFYNDFNLVNKAVREGVFLGSNFATYDIPSSGADNPDVDNLKPELKEVLPVIGGLLKKYNLDSGALLTSGYRSAERNKNANGAKESYHLDGDAIDIYVPQVGEDSQKSAQLHEVFSPYFKEIKYHNSGSGKHLHLAGYKGGLEGGYTEKERQDICSKLKDTLEYEELIKRIDYEKTMEYGLKQILEQGNIEKISDIEKIATAYTRNNGKVFTQDFIDRATKLFKMQQSLYNEELDEKTFFSIKEKIFNNSITSFEQLTQQMKQYGGGTKEQRKELAELVFKRKDDFKIVVDLDSWGKSLEDKAKEIVKTENIGDLPPD